MGEVQHGCATVSHRGAIGRGPMANGTPSEQRYSDDALRSRKIAERYGLNEKTVRKWRRRTSVEDAPMGPKTPRSTVLSAEEEAACVAFRRHTLLALDDCLYALQGEDPPAIGPRAGPNART